MNLTLQSDHTAEKVHYKEVDYKADQFIKIQALMNQGLPVEFVHVYPQKHALFVAKPFGKQTFLAVSGLELINPENFIE